MKKNLLIFYILLLFCFAILGCETPGSTLNEASSDIQKGITGQGQLQERGWEDVDIYQ